LTVGDVGALRGGTQRCDLGEDESTFWHEGANNSKWWGKASAFESLNGRRGDVRVR